MSETARRKRGTAIKLKCSQVAAEVWAAIERAGGIEILRCCVEARRRFIDHDVADLIERADGRAVGFLGREVIRALNPGVIEAIEAAQRRAYERHRRPKRRTPATPRRKQVCRPLTKCGACGRMGSLLSTSGECVNRARCDRRQRSRRESPREEDARKGREKSVASGSAP